MSDLAGFMVEAFDGLHLEHKPCGLAWNWWGEGDEHDLAELVRLATEHRCDPQ